MSTTFFAGVVQLNSSKIRSENLRVIEILLRQASEAGCELVVLPEVFDCFCEDAEKFEHAEPSDGGETISFLKELCRELKMFLVAGTMILRTEDPGLVRNRLHVINPSGEITAVYDKIHLFDVNLEGKASYRESQFTKPGLQPVVCETPWGKMGLSICYDLRFPELYREYARLGAKFLVVPSAFTLKTGMDHWEVLVRARAIENQCFVLAPNQVGSHLGDLKTWGHSMIVDPWGVVLCQKGEGAGLAVASLDLERLDSARETVPCLSHRRLK